MGFWIWLGAPGNSDGKAYYSPNLAERHSTWNPCYKWKFCHQALYGDYPACWPLHWQGLRDQSIDITHQKQVPVGELVLQNTLVFLVEVYLKLVLGYSSEIGHCEVDFHNVHVKLCWISAEIQVILKQEIIELVRLSATKSIREIGFSSSWISIRSGSLIGIKCVSKSTKYVSQLFISIIALSKFWP